MAVIQNASEIESVILNNLPKIITDKFGFFITILKAAGIGFLIYLVYLIFKGILGWKDRNRLKKIESRVEIIDQKIDILIKGRKKKGKVNTR